MASSSPPPYDAKRLVRGFDFNMIKVDYLPIGVELGSGQWPDHLFHDKDTISSQSVEFKAFFKLDDKRFRVVSETNGKYTTTAELLVDESGTSLDYSDLTCSCPFQVHNKYSNCKHEARLVVDLGQDFPYGRLEELFDQGDAMFDPPKKTPSQAKGKASSSASSSSSSTESSKKPSSAKRGRKTKAKEEQEQDKEDAPPKKRGKKAEA